VQLPANEVESLGDMMREEAVAMLEDGSQALIKGVDWKSKADTRLSQAETRLEQLEAIICKVKPAIIAETARAHMMLKPRAASEDAKQHWQAKAACPVELNLAQRVIRAALAAAAQTCEHPSPDLDQQMVKGTPAESSKVDTGVFRAAIMKVRRVWQNREAAKQNTVSHKLSWASTGQCQQEQRPAGTSLHQYEDSQTQVRHRNGMGLQSAVGNPPHRNSDSFIDVNDNKLVSNLCVGKAMNAGHTNSQAAKNKRMTR